MASTNGTSKTLVVIVGITGNQGSSVARRFLADPTNSYTIRGLTRNPFNPIAQSFASQGVEIVRADLDDPTSIRSAFAGANLIFTVTNYWEPFFRPDCRAKADEQGLSYLRYAYNVEYQQGVNMADAAAATVDTLAPNGLIASTEGPGKEATNGRYGPEGLLELDAKCDVFPKYVEAKHQELAEKMSCVWTGTFTHSWGFMPWLYFGRVGENEYTRRLSTTPDALVPHLDVAADLGSIVHAIAQMPAGRTYLAASQMCSWKDFMAIWSKATGKSAFYQQISRAEMKTLYDPALGRDPLLGTEISDLNDMFSDVGLWCGRKDLLSVEDIRKAGIECPTTSLEDSFRNTDWTIVFNQEIQ